MVSINWRLFRYFDWVSFALICIIACTGLLLVFSATYTPEHAFSLFFKKQSIGLLFGIIIYLVCAITDYRSLMRKGYFAYFGVLALLLFTLIKGSIGMGAQRWIDLFFFKLQPSELSKLLFPSFIAYHFYTIKRTHYSWRLFLPVIAILVISFLFIMKQPDLGTALIILFSGAVLLWLAGIGNKFFIYSCLSALLLVPVLWKVLKPYQKNRITVFLGQGQTQKERYHIEQSAIAIGSGGLTGKGFLHGTQNKLHFLPESRTDFIFAVLCEEIGFIGALCIIFLYVMLFIRFARAIEQITTPHTQLLATGLVIHIVLSVLINIGMVINLLPVVGIPLPLISYGLSNLWITCASLGWFQSITMRNHE